MGGVEVSHCFFMTTARERGEGSVSRPGRSVQVWKTSPLLGFDPQTVQPVASRYTDYATQPVGLVKSSLEFKLLIAMN